MPAACKLSTEKTIIEPVPPALLPCKRYDSTSDNRTSRDAYVEYLEEKLERIMNSCLELNCFSDRLSKLEELVATEQSVYADPRKQKSGSVAPCETTIMKNRLLVLEEKFNRYARDNSVSEDRNHTVISRINEVEKTCMKLADDSMAAIQSLHGDFSSVKSHAATECDVKLGALELRLSQKITDSIDQVTLVLRKLIAFQKILYNRTEETRASTPAINTKAAAIQELYREIEYMQHNKMS